MKIEIPAAKKLVYETRIPMRWGDMDAMGHVVICFELLLAAVGSC